MERVTSRFLVFFVGRSAGFRFRGVSVLVIGQFCVGDGEAGEGRMVGSGSKFPVKPEGTNLWRILVAQAMRHESIVRNRHKEFRKCAVGSSMGEGIFTDRSLAFKSNVL